MRILKSNRKVLSNYSSYFEYSILCKYYIKRIDELKKIRFDIGDKKEFVGNLYAKEMSVVYKNTIITELLDSFTRQIEIYDRDLRIKKKKLFKKRVKRTFSFLFISCVIALGVVFYRNMKVVINIDTNGGSSVVVSENLKNKDMPYELLTTMTKEGYTFSGWYQDESFS